MTVINAEVLIEGSHDRDVRLMQAVSKGDTEAFTTIVDRHKDALVNYLTHLTGDRDRAEEVGQEAFLRLYETAHRYDERGKLSSYLFSIATNLVRTEQRRRTRWLRLVPNLVIHSKREQSTPQAGVLASEACEEVRRALDELPLHLRAPIILREIEGWSYREIADSLDCRIGTVKSRINRGRERLRELLSGYWNRRGEQ